jgi:hypothetical protein
MKLVTIACAVALTFGGAARPSLTATVAAAQRPQLACLHGDNESPEQRARRAQALALAREINGNQFNVAMQKTGAFQPIANLELTMPTPPGFDVRLTTDGKAYAFSLRDTTDPCLFGFFSDQQGLIFQGRVIQ